jgi:hypothetical protein
LKKRISTLLKERERKAKEQEETAKQLFEDALVKTRKMQAANLLIKEKMKQAEGMGIKSNEDKNHIMGDAIRSPSLESHPLSRLKDHFMRNLD